MAEKEVKAEQKPKAAKKTKVEKMIKITLVKSVIGSLPGQRKVVESLGLRKIRQSVERPDTPQFRGAIEKVKHLLKIEEL